MLHLLRLINPLQTLLFLVKILDFVGVPSRMEAKPRVPIPREDTHGHRGLIIRDTSISNSSL